MMRSLLALFVVATVAGCATMPPPIAPDVALRIHRVAVVSVTADEFTRQFVGVTVFGNELEKRSIAAWGADKAYEGQLSSAVERVFGATVVATPNAGADFTAVNDLNGPWDAPAFWGPNWEKIEPATRALCEKDALDALIVVARRKSGDLFGGTNQAVAGAGIYARRSKALLHLLSVVSLLDCRTGKRLDTRFLVRKTSQADGRVRYGPPTLPLPEDLARTPIPEWTPDAEARIRDELLALPKDAWEDTLRTMWPSK